MTVITDADRTRISRLPNYARVLIARLEQEITSLEGRLAERMDDPIDGTEPPCDTFLNNGYERPRTPLGEGASVQYHLDPANDWTRMDVRLTDRNGRRALEVMGQTGIVVSPLSGNLVAIWLER